MYIDVYLSHSNFEDPQFAIGRCEYDEEQKTFGEITILSGSPYVENPITKDDTTPRVAEQKKKIILKREKLKDDGYIDNGKFIKDIKFDSLNEAGTIILGRNLNAKTAFKVKRGDEYVSLKEYIENSGSSGVDPKSTDDFAPSKDKSVAENVIFYGVPGCGKSYYINSLLTSSTGEVLEDKYYKRILFYPEYSYSDFVGQVMPQTTETGSIEYKFVAGPFVEMLCDAYENVEKEYFLVIEEINRGNAPAIFGDLFQLLDRNEDGESEYGIYNKNIIDELRNKTHVDVKSVKIPPNLSIFATMNTCDQNVFTLDTAFKRRWRMKRIPNDFSDEQFEKQLGNLEIISGITWKRFGLAINSAITKYCGSGASFEDKQLGTYFVKKSEVEDVRSFAEKVMMYLWDDVVKYDKSRLFDTINYKTLDEVIEGFVAGKNVFSSHCEEIEKLYRSVKE